MNLHDLMIKSGHKMFRWRSYLPLLIIPPLFLALKESAEISGFFSEWIEDGWIFFCLAISLFGLALRGLAIGYVPAGTSGRNTKEQKADHLNTKGLYSIVRNPLYLGNFIIILGVLLLVKVWWLVAIGALVFFIYMERIILAEEKFLAEKFGPTYTEWQKMTPVILPNFSLWQRPVMPFCFKTVLKREYPGLMAIGIIFFAIEFITDVFFEGKNILKWAVEDYEWPLLLAITLIITLSLRFLKKNTRLLKVKGR